MEASFGVMTIQLEILKTMNGKINKNWYDKKDILFVQLHTAHDRLHER